MRPRARRGGLVVRDLPGETVVYDADSHRAHCLNRTSALVFRHANGRRTVSDLARLLATDTGTEADHGVVRAALASLREARLLESADDGDGFATSDAPLDRSRRAMMRRVGIGAAALLPVVTSILVPTPAEAAATCIPADSCPGNTEQPCYNTNPGVECPSFKCIGPMSCG